MKNFGRLIGSLLAALVYAVFGLVILAGGVVVFLAALPVGIMILVGSILLYVLGVGVTIAGTRRGQ